MIFPFCEFTKKCVDFNMFSMGRHILMMGPLRDQQNAKSKHAKTFSRERVTFERYFFLLNLESKREINQKTTTTKQQQQNYARCKIMWTGILVKAFCLSKEKEARVQEIGK